MTSTVFTDRVTPIVASWLNDVNDAVYAQAVLLTQYAECDGVTNDTLGVLAAIAAAPEGGTIICPSGKSCLISPDLINFSKIVNFVCLGTGFRATTGSRPSFMFTAAAGGGFLWKYSNLQTNMALLRQGLAFRNIAFNGGGFSFTDSVVIVEGVSAPEIEGCTISNATGNALRLREAFEPFLWYLGVFGIDASGSQGSLYIDNVYNGNNLLNVNNLRIRDSHFENIKGPHIFSHATANLVIFQLTGTKFEWGLSGIPAGGPWAVFELRNVTQGRIQGNHFTNFNAANKYDRMLKAGHSSSANANCVLVDNDFTAHDASTYLVDSQPNGRVIARDNTKFSASGADFLFVCTSAKAPNLFEQPRDFDTASYPAQSSRLIEYPRRAPGFISAHEVFYDNASSFPFEADASAKNPAGTVLTTTLGSVVLCQLPLNWLYDFPGSIRIGVRCKSASGAGTIDMQVNTTALATQTVPIAYDVLWFEVNNDVLAVMGNSANDRFRVRAAAGNAEKLSIDILYVEPLPWSYSKTFIYDPGAINDGTGTTTTTTVTGAALGDSVAVFAPYDLQGFIVTGYVSAADTVAVRVQNETGAGPVSLGSGSWIVKVTKR